VDDTIVIELTVSVAGLAAAEAPSRPVVDGSGGFGFDGFDGFGRDIGVEDEVSDETEPVT
jgi:hypothetical protein